ncbi:MAG TPA: FGGY family carbohydrate kinase [Thermomicrobiales bacterium]|nr:FGGY family carbohydrate kinase [Thermomicrobiales bacterium]
MTTAIPGLDLGTSSAKASIVAANGQMLSRCQASYPNLHPQPGFGEQRPADWWQAVVDAVGNARRFAPNAGVMAIQAGSSWNGEAPNVVAPNPVDERLYLDRLSMFRVVLDRRMLLMHRPQEP